MAKSKKDLGMGLEALFSENDTGNLQARVLRITEISPNKAQPRRDFDEKSLETLSESIRQHGVLQPILVRPLASGGYQIVAGERRWRASRMAGLEEMPVYIRELTDTETARLALVENLQREDLNPVEEALGYKKLMEDGGLTQDDLSKIVGKSRPAVANALRLLGLDPKTMELVKKGEVSPGHARALLSVEDVNQREELARRIIREGLSVRQAEALVKKDAAPKKVTPKKRESIYHEVELSLKESAGRVCKVSENSKGGGTLTVEFYDVDDLTAIANALGELNYKNGGK